MQERLQSRNLRSVERLLTHKRFRAGYDFLCLRAESDNALEVYAQWWTDFQEADENRRKILMDQLPRAPRKRRRSRKKRKNSAGEVSEASDS